MQLSTKLLRQDCNAALAYRARDPTSDAKA